MTMRKASGGKPHGGNPHVLFGNGRVRSEAFGMFGHATTIPGIVAGRHVPQCDFA